MGTEKSVMKKGLLKEATIYDGIKIAEASFDPESDPALAASLQPRLEDPVTPTSYAHAVGDVGTPSESGGITIDLPLQIEV